MVNPTSKRRTAKANASDRVLEILQGRILSGELRAGDRIPPEMKLCNAYGVSRVTVRAAIQRLIGAGLLESQQGGGTYVRPATDLDAINAMIPMVALAPPNRIDMFEFRRIMEVESVGLAAMRANVEMVAAMDETVLRMRESATAGEMARWDLEFHRLIAQASDNGYIIKVFDVLKDVYYALLCQNTQIMGARGTRFHEMICRAIEIRDVEMAQRYMKEHLTDTIKQTLSPMEENRDKQE